MPSEMYIFSNTVTKAFHTVKTGKVKEASLTLPATPRRNVLSQQIFGFLLISDILRSHN